MESADPRAADYAGAGKANELSCVLRVEAGGSSILLTGDIELRAEARLGERRADVRSDVLLVPHHGSRTSSGAAFIAAVAPRLAIVSAGYRNRFGHPTADVLARYAQSGVELLRTDRDGAIVLRLGPQGVAEAERRVNPRYWK